MSSDFSGGRDVAELIRGVIEQQKNISAGISLLRQQTCLQQRQLDVLWRRTRQLPHLVSDNDAKNNRQKSSQPVTARSFERFLMHFERSMSEIRSLIAATDSSQQSDDSLYYATTSKKRPREAATDSGRKRNRGNHAEASGSNVKSSTTQPDDKKWFWRCRARNERTFRALDSELSERVEFAFIDYGQNRHAKAGLKFYEDIDGQLYINFDSRQGSWCRKKVLFERVLLDAE